jgi:diguanylate cyclase (GGDEF)-like protein
VFAVAGLLGAIIGNYSVGQLRDRIGLSLATDASRIADRLDKEMDARSRELNLIGALDPMRDLKDPEEIQGLLDTLRRSEPDYLWLAVTDLHGRVMAATDGSLVGNDLSGRFDVRDMLRGSPTRPSDPMRLVQPGQSDRPARLRPMIDISRPIRTGDGTVVGVIVAQLSWDWIRALCSTMLTPDSDGAVHRETFVVANTDAILVGPPGAATGAQLVLPAINRARAGILGASLETWPDDQPYLTGTGFVAGEGQFPGAGTAPLRWTVLVREAEASAYAPALQLRTAILIVGVILSLMVAAIGWVITGFITRPLRKIATAADRLRQGENVELPSLRGASEVVMLSHSLRALVATLMFNQVKLDEMESAAQHDALTGLMNRSGLQAWLARVTTRARTEKTGLLVLVGDLDGFKAINDTLGHSAGDAVLCEVGRRLQTSVRGHDAVARLGGDEFVLVLHAPLGLADRAAVETAHRVLERVTESYAIDGIPMRVGLSLGGAGWPEDDRQLDLVLNKADAALYAAKRGGKGRIVFHREPALH